jgi:hypothetical protein
MIPSLPMRQWLSIHKRSIPLGGTFPEEPSLCQYSGLTRFRLPVAFYEF